MTKNGIVNQVLMTNNHLIDISVISSFFFILFLITKGGLKTIIRISAVQHSCIQFYFRRITDITWDH